MMRTEKYVIFDGLTCDISCQKPSKKVILGIFRVSFSGY